MRNGSEMVPETYSEFVGYSRVLSGTYLSGQGLQSDAHGEEISSFEQIDRLNSWILDRRILRTVI